MGCFTRVYSDFFVLSDGTFVAHERLLKGDVFAWRCSALTSSVGHVACFGRSGTGNKGYDMRSRCWYSVVLVGVIAVWVRDLDGVFWTSEVASNGM